MSSIFTLSLLSVKDCGGSWVTRVGPVPPQGPYRREVGGADTQRPCGNGGRGWLTCSKVQEGPGGQECGRLGKLKEAPGAVRGAQAC